MNKDNEADILATDGFSLMCQHRFTGAIVLFNKALEIDEFHLHAHQLRAFCYLMLNQNAPIETRKSDIEEVVSGLDRSLLIATDLLKSLSE